MKKLIGLQLTKSHLKNQLTTQGVFKKKFRKEHPWIKESSFSEEIFWIFSAYLNSLLSKKKNIFQNLNFMYSLSYTVGKGSMQHALSWRKLGQTFLLKNQTFDGIKCARGGQKTRSVLAFLQVFWRRSFCFYVQYLPILVKTEIYSSQ